MKHPTPVRRRRKHRRVYNQPLSPRAAENLYFSQKAQALLEGIVFTAVFCATMFFLVALE